MLSMELEKKPVTGLELLGTLSLCTQYCSTNSRIASYIYQLLQLQNELLLNIDAVFLHHYLTKFPKSLHAVIAKMAHIANLKLIQICQCAFHMISQLNSWVYIYHKGNILHIASSADLPSVVKFGSPFVLRDPTQTAASACRKFRNQQRGMVSHIFPLVIISQYSITDCFSFELPFFLHPRRVGEEQQAQAIKH